MKYDKMNPGVEKRDASGGWLQTLHITFGKVLGIPLHIVRHALQTIFSTLHGWSSDLNLENEEATTIYAKITPMQTAAIDFFPEQREEIIKKDDGVIGIAFSGGGARSHTLSCGYLRGMHYLQNEGKESILHKADYISCVSGGSWASSIFCYADFAREELVGPETDPKTLTMKNLKQANPGKACSVIYNFKGVFDGFKELALGTNSNELWQKVISNNILKPFDLDDTFVALDKSHMEDMQARNPILRNKKFKVVYKSVEDRRPFCIINTTLAGPNEFNTGQGNNLQVTPMYSGVPFYRNMEKMGYQTVNWYDSLTPATIARKRDYLLLTVGGGVVETFALNSAGPIRRKDFYPKQDQNVEAPVVVLKRYDYEATSFDITAKQLNELDQTGEKMVEINIEAETKEAHVVDVTSMPRTDSKHKLRNDASSASTAFKGSDSESEEEDAIKKKRSGVRGLVRRITGADAHQLVMKKFDSGGHKCTKMKAPERFFTLGDAVGASSAAHVAAFTNRAVPGGFEPEITYWPILSHRYIQFSGYQKPEVLGWGDGGLTENTGLLPLLQRGVKRVVCFINSDTKLERDFKDDVFVKYDVRQNKIVYECCSSQLLALFGCVEFMDLGFNYTNATVFRKSRLNDVMKEMLKNVEAGRGAISRQTLEVLPNRAWNILGGYFADVLFVYNEHVGGFEKNLPLDTQAEIAKGDRGTFQKFPFFSTMFQNKQAFSLQQEEAVLLSSQAEWLVKENAEMFIDFFKDIKSVKKSNSQEMEVETISNTTSCTIITN